MCFDAFIKQDFAAYGLEYRKGEDQPNDPNQPQFAQMDQRSTRFAAGCSFDTPRLTLIGSNQLYIENHRGVVHFSEERLVLDLSSGRLEISGNNLMIRTILPEEVAVEGRITNIQYLGTGMRNEDTESS